MVAVAATEEVAHVEVDEELQIRCADTEPKLR